MTMQIRCVYARLNLKILFLFLKRRLIILQYHKIMLYIIILLLHKYLHCISGRVTHTLPSLDFSITTKLHTSWLTGNSC